MEKNKNTVNKSLRQMHTLTYIKSLLYLCSKLKSMDASWRSPSLAMSSTVSMLVWCIGIAICRVIVLAGKSYFYENLNL